MHMLDLIMYFVTMVILYLTLILFNKEYTDSHNNLAMSSIEGLFVAFGFFVAMLIYTIVYIIVFGVFDNNWVDIFRWFGTVDISNVTDFFKGINFNL